MSTVEDLLQQGIAAARGGRREEARTLLMRVIEADERNEQGWLWLAGVVDDPNDMHTCLQNVLDLNPGNLKAQQGLAWVKKRYGLPAAPESVPAAAPDSVANTGPTTRLAPEAVAAAAAAAQALQPPPRPALDEPAARPENPCPYCGAPTTLLQKYCTQCRNNLMIRTAPRDKRSVALTVLAVLWGISSVLTILGGLLILLGGVLASQTTQNFARQLGPRADIPSTTDLLIPGIVVLIIGGLSIAVTRGLLRQARWAYIIHLILTAISLLGSLIQIAVGGMLAGLARTPGALDRGDPRAAQIATTAIGLTIFCIVIWQLIYILLTVLSFRDFYGSPVRFQPAVEGRDHLEHYNHGVAYKDRGMWYIATKEWEMAASKAPLDLNYLRGLGLAYAQSKRLYPQSTTYLQSVRRLLLSRKDELYAQLPELERLNLL